MGSMRFRRRTFVLVFIAVTLIATYSKLLLLFGSLSSLAFGKLSVSSSTDSQTSPTATSTTSVSLAGTALSGDYTGHWRPQIHFSAPRGFINDPNGMFVDDKGVYHLYYQYNPTNTISGNPHWGHATSLDLYHWTNQAVALAPDNYTAPIFSGSAVIDPNNTSGFFPDQTNGVVAFYTLAGPVQQVQSLAYSLDGGFTFIKYDGNPLIQIGSPQFRDPKVFWYEDHWVMVVAYADEFVVGIFTSPNMVDWTHASNFSHHGLLGSLYECPNLVEMPLHDSDETMWLMYISIQPGAPLGGSIGEYFPGYFNGTHFTPVDGAARIADWGKDNYAAQFFYNIPAGEHQISIAWASNWQYCNYVPTGPSEGWQSTMSLPRVNYLKNATRTGWTMVSLPYGLDRLRQETAVAASTEVGGNGKLVADLSSYDNNAFLIDVNITGIDTTVLGNQATVNFTITANESGETLRGGVFLSGDATMWVDRGGVKAFDNIYYTDRFSAAFVLDREGTAFDFQVVVDRSIIEVFGLGGEKSATLVHFARGTLDTVEVASGNLNQGAHVSASVHSLASTWSAGRQT